MIEAKNLVKHYRQGAKTIRAVDGINLTIKEGEFVVILGPSGCGKSTLLQLLGGLDRPTSGEVRVGTVNFSTTSDRKLTEVRRNVLGFVFQNFNLIPTLTAGENVEAAIAKRSNKDRHAVRTVLDSVGLTSREHHLPSKLSGGEQQRVAIARALINHPSIILADEPTGNLDSETGEEILDILQRLNREQKKTVVVITHNEYAKKFSTRVLSMKDGKLL